MSDPKIALAMIGWRSADIPFMYYRDKLRTVVDIEIPGVGDALVSRARAMVATKFMEQTDCDVLLSVDTDITEINGSPDSALQICQQAVCHDIVAGLYVSRGRGERCKPTSVWAPGVEITFANNPAPVPIMWAAGGFVAIHRRVFERLAQDLPLCHEQEPVLRHYPFYDPFAVENHLGQLIELSEDFALCERARSAGFGVWLNPAVRLEHWGVEPHRLEDMTIKEPPPLLMKLRRNQDGSYTRQWPDWDKQGNPVERPKLVLAR